MKTVKFSEIEEIKHSLFNMADNCKRIAESLNDKGEKLDNYEKQIIRLSAIPILQEIQEIMLIKFMKGETTEREIERIIEISEKYAI